MSTREELIDVFNDTLAFIDKNPFLKEAAEKSRNNTELYLANDWPRIQDKTRKSGNVTLLQRRTFAAALYMHEKKPNSKIAVLNFASATNPGGGVSRGSRSQEECLCRCSTLYKALAQPKLLEEFYTMHRDKHNTLYTNACIYTPDVIICKTDTDYPQHKKESDFVTVDVITCAAPNLRNFSISYEEYIPLMTERIKHIFHTAHLHDVDTLILGAFGCGAFKNNPFTVAGCFQSMVEKHGKDFEDIVFAIYSNRSEIDNYKAFKTVFGF